jgi:hypothetical protein
MDHLKKLKCGIDLVPGMAEPRWPSKLTALRLYLMFSSVKKAARNNAERAAAFASLSSLIGQSLIIGAPNVSTLFLSQSDKGGWHPRDSLPPDFFTPLLQWPLASLTLDDRCELSSGVYQVLRRMPHLTEVIMPMDELRQYLSVDGPSRSSRS